MLSNRLDFGGIFKTTILTGLAILACQYSWAESHPGTVPLAPVPPTVPFTSRYQTQQARLQESETKARLMARGGQADPLLTENMQQYDALAYGLTLDLNPATEILTGQVEMRARVIAGSLSLVEMHLRANMSVSQVWAGGIASTHTRIGDLLRITLDRAYENGEELVVAVQYSGNPAGSCFGWDQYGGQPLIWTLSEPYGARHWWPCKDLNTDKADDVDLHITVPDDLIVASNGLLAETTVPEAGKKTFHWQSRYPIATYLVSLAIHPFATFADSYTGLDGQQMPLEHFVVPSKLVEAQATFGVTVDMLEVFAQGFGEYPFIEEKYGHAHFPWGGGMEHQTMTSLYYDVFTEHIISHELGHQWWGDMVTCADFGHIWLNEGFATWSEAYWREMNEGRAAYHEEMNDARYLGEGTIFVEDPTDFYAIFNYYLSYLKASWVPHMLRRVVGEEEFFVGLAQYRETYQYGSATTEQFRDVMATASDRNLDNFFQQWIYEGGHPVYRWAYTLNPTETGQRLDLMIEQVQSGGVVFDMPLDVRVWDPQGNYVDHVVHNNQRQQWFSFEVAPGAIFVELDPDNWVLCEKIYHGASPVQDLPVDGQGLTSCYPNPFNPSTTIRYSVDQSGPVTVMVYDLAGRQVAQLVAEDKPAGTHQVVWDGRDRRGARSPSGIYLVRMNNAQGTSQLKITMVQ